MAKYPLWFVFWFWTALLAAQSYRHSLSVLPTGRLLSKADSIVSQGMEFIGRSYRSPRPDGGVFDCSGFVQYIFAQHHIPLPRSSSSMGQAVRTIPLDEVQAGDLLFFKGRDSRSQSIGHVGLVVNNGKEGIHMLHSCSRGIRIDSLNMAYYKTRFLFAGRVLQADGTPLFQQNRTKSPTDKVPQDSIRIAAVGDIMLGTNYPDKSYLPPNDGKDLLAPVDSILKAADLCFGNLEGVILSGEGQLKTCSDPKVCYAFKSPDHYAFFLQEAGFDVLSLANNHVGDFGWEGKKNTKRLLDSAGLFYAGLTEHPWVIFQKDSIRYGFCAFSPNRGTLSIHDTLAAQQVVKQLDSLADIVVVSFHGGGEGFDFQHISDKEEHYLGENRGNPYRFARAVIHAGADLVFGHGPHLPRAIDLYQNRFIAYSLGNFATYARFNLQGAKGFAPIALVTVDSEGRFLEGKIESALQKGEGGPKPDPSGAAFREIKRLTEADFPNGPIRFEDNGRFYQQ